jgi:hypothetical protein
VYKDGSRSTRPQPTRPSLRVLTPDGDNVLPKCSQLCDIFYLQLVQLVLLSHKLQCSTTRSCMEHMQCMQHLRASDSTMTEGPPARSIYATRPSACCCAWSDCPMRRTAPAAPPGPSSGYTPPVFFTGGSVYSTLIALRASKIAVYISVRASPSKRRSTPAHLNDTFEIEFVCHVERLSASCRGTASRRACEGKRYCDAMLMLCSDRRPLHSLPQAVQGGLSEPPHCLSHLGVCQGEGGRPS